MTLEFGMCCNPIPGDPIIGHMKKGTGLIIHTHDCKTLSAPGTQNVKFLDVAWSENTDKMFTVKISLIVSDAQGVLASSLRNHENGFEYTERYCRTRRFICIQLDDFHNTSRKPHASRYRDAQPAKDSCCYSYKSTEEPSKSVTFTILRISHFFIF